MLMFSQAYSRNQETTLTLEQINGEFSTSSKMTDSKCPDTEIEPFDLEN